ncbi:MAG TPA: RDD family protein [Terracidiphilus sp.]|nr:RDD family protein [Terracidiphilus sp.]
MSTLGQPHPEPAWKQEVNRRLAQHKHRKGTPAQQGPAQPQAMGNSRAAEAAARVAARYSKAPTYSQMQAEEARTAVRAAEIATKVALEAQATAESALAELHAASAEPQRGPAVVESIRRARVEPAEEAAIAVAEPERPMAVEAAAEPEFELIEVAAQPEPESVRAVQVTQGQTFGIRWEPDMPVRVLQPKAAPAPEPFDLETEDWWTPAQVRATLRNEPIAIEADPGHANLIEFPRELVATRKMRPRLAEPTPAPQSQLSIFEVDPGSVSTEPAAAETVAPVPSWSEREWSGPEWSGIELGEHPMVEDRPQVEPARPAQQVHLAPLGYRLMAAVVDGCLILGAFFSSAMFLATHMQSMPAPRSAEAMVVAGLLIVGFVYHALFFAMAVSTPGMRYAGIALSTFEDDSPTRAQLRHRLGAMALSLLPVGLGFAWSLFDDDHLSWHDRISQTYLRKR